MSKSCDEILRLWIINNFCIMEINKVFSFMFIVEIYDFLYNNYSNISIH